MTLRTKREIGNLTTYSNPNPRDYAEIPILHKIVTAPECMVVATISNGNPERNGIKQWTKKFKA
jgi:hypothetical protein